MPRKCSIWGCRSGYNENKRSDRNASFRQNVKILSFPKDPEERRKWVQKFPYEMNHTNITPFMGVCVKHWPPDACIHNIQKPFSRPKIPPPSIFPSTFINPNARRRRRPYMAYSNGKQKSTQGSEGG